MVKRLVLKIERSHCFSRSQWQETVEIDATLNSTFCVFLNITYTTPEKKLVAAIIQIVKYGIVFLYGCSNQFFGCSSKFLIVFSCLSAIYNMISIG